MNLLEDDEFGELVATPGRVAALGFKPECEVLMNHLLPYAEDLDQESTIFLEQVKTNLAKAVMLREMKPACCVWSSRLLRYIRMYGLKFSKEDHIKFIKLTYELVLIPDLEPCKINKFMTLFILLTKKRYLISPEDLTLPWRPLYDLGTKLFNKSATTIGMYHYLSPKPRKEADTITELIRKYMSGSGLENALDMFGLTGNHESELPNSLEGSFVSMVKCAKPYFELSATKEILAEMLPQVNPWSSETYMIGHLSIFLPVTLPHDKAAHGHELWFDELMMLWDTCFNAQCGVSDLMTLFAGLAKRCPGAVDWSPHVPKMFSRYLHSLYLPVSYKDMQLTKVHHIVSTILHGMFTVETKQMASWLVWSINPDGVVLKHLRSFLAGVESFLQSANTGRWSYRLRDFLRKLAREFLTRVRREREDKSRVGWENKTPESYKIRDEDITEFVNIMLEPTIQAVHSRNGSLDISLSLQNLATLRPAIVIPPLLDRLRNALSSLTEPHRVTAGMGAVVAVARPMLRGAIAGYPEGPTHVVPLLMAVLPGLDPNDPKKTLISLHFILIFVWMVPLIDCSSAHEHWNDLTDEELLTCESTAQFEDFVLVFLDRLFIIVESSALENVRLDTKDAECFRSKSDAVTETALSSAAIAVLMQCSPKIFKEALRKFKAFATDSTFETSVSGSMVGVLLRVFARVDPEATLPAFVPKLCEELCDLLNDEALNDDSTSRDIIYRMVLLRYVVECDGAVLVRFVPEILPVLDKALKLKDKNAQTRACDVLRNILKYFSSTEIKDWRSSPKDYSKAPEEWLPIREWGHGCHVKNADLKWHVPCEEEAKCAQMLIDRYLKPAVETLRSWAKGDINLTREEMHRTLNVVNAAMACGPFYPQPNEEPVLLVESNVPATSLPYQSGVKFEIKLNGVNMRVALTDLLVEVQARMLADKSDDTKCFESLIHIWEHVLILKFGRGIASMETRLRSYAALERSMDGRGSPGKGGGGPIRMLIADAVRLHEDSRTELVSESGITPTALKALDAIFELSINTYTSVRVQAQSRLYWILNHHPYSYRVLVPKLSKLILAGGEGEEWHDRHKAVLCILLGPRNGPLIAKQDWEVVKALWPNVLKAPLSEKPSIHKLEQTIGDTLHRHFPTVNTRLTMTESAIEAAKCLLSETQLKDEGFISLLATAVEREKEHSDRVEKLYLDIIEELVEYAETPNIPWRRLELAVQMITFCPSVQTNYPINAVKFIIRSLLHDNIMVRKIAMKLTHFVLRQCKRKLKKVDVDPYEMAGMKRPEKPVRGYRKDIEWVVWTETPMTDEEWEGPVLKNSNYGYYAWPEKLTMVAPPSEQVLPSNLPPEELSETEKFVYEFFCDDKNIEKLVAYMTFEDKKGKDKFNGLRFCVFKLLFSEFGERITDKLLPHALRGASGTFEGGQRFATELTAAAIRAPAYWTRDRATAIHNKVLEIIAAALTKVAPETLEDWGTCLATSADKIDARRAKTLLDGIVELCVPPPSKEDIDLDLNTSFVTCAKFYMLQGTIGSLKWRTTKLTNKIVQKLDAANYMQHPYQIVRESVGSLLMTIFDAELIFPGGEREGGPCFAEFLARVVPRLSALYDENGDIVIKPAAYVAGPGCEARGAEGGEGAEGERVSPAHCATPRLPIAVASLATEHDAPQPDHSHPVREGESSSVCVSGPARGVATRLSVRLDAALRLAGDAAPTAAKEHERAANLLTTVLRTVMGVIVRGVASRAGCALSICALSCSLAGRALADELPRAAAAMLGALALAHHSPQEFDDILDELERRAEDRSWWARLACLDLAQPLLFYGLPYMCAEPQRAVKAEKLAAKLMSDSRLEVRQSAAKLLTGLMHCRALPDEEKTLKTLTRSCRSKNLVERHHGVLGLCSYLASRPYSLGPKIGDVLAELARHTNAPDPIPATIRTILAEFRRTHQDDWAKHREQLTEEELDLLADLSSPPTYCA